MADWNQPEKIYSIEAGQYAKPKGVSEVVRASVAMPTQGPKQYSKSVKTPKQQFARKPDRAFVTMSKPTQMDLLVDRFDVRVKAMIRKPSKLTRASFYQTCQDILATGNDLPTASAVCLRYGITRDLILKGLVRRGYMPSYRGPGVLQLKAQRAVNWFTAQPAVSRAFARRGEHGEDAPGGGTNAQLEDCRSVVCPDAGPLDECPECDDLEGKSRIQMRANSAVVIKSNTGGIRVRTDGNPVRYNSLGQRIR